MLYADLAIIDVQIGSSYSWFIPGDRFKATVTVQNVGYLPATFNTELEVYADSLETDEAASLGILEDLHIKLDPGEIKKVIVPCELDFSESGSYRIVAFANTRNPFGFETELNTENNFYSSSLVADFALRFGSYADRSNVKLIEIDEFNRIAISLTGGGYGEIDDGLLTLYGTTPNSICSVVGAGAWREFSFVQNMLVECDGPMKSFKAPGASFVAGSELQFAGGLGELQVANLRDTTVFVGATPAAGLKISAREILGSTIDVNGHLASFVARKVDAEEELDTTIRASSLGTVTVAGNFIGNLEVDGPSYGSQTRVAVKGQAGGDWNIAGDVSSISIGYTLSEEQWRLQVRGTLKSFTASASVFDVGISAWGFGSVSVKGSMIDSYIFSGFVSYDGDVVYGPGPQYGGIASLSIGANLIQCSIAAGYSEGFPVYYQSSAIPKIQIKGYIDWQSEITALYLPLSIKTASGVIYPAFDLRFRLDL